MHVLYGCSMHDMLQQYCAHLACIWQVPARLQLQGLLCVLQGQLSHMCGVMPKDGTALRVLGGYLTYVPAPTVPEQGCGRMVQVAG